MNNNNHSITAFTTLIFAGVLFIVSTSSAMAASSVSAYLVNPQDIAKAQLIQIPFNHVLSCSFSSSSSSTSFCSDSYTIPANQQLVVEFINWHCADTNSETNPGDLNEIQFKTISPSGSQMLYQMTNDTLAKKGTINGSQLTRIYASLGSQVSATFVGSNLTGCDLIVSGQLVDQ
jgi:hypothetical protein